MPDYEYTALTVAGDTVAKTLQADSRKAAVAQLTSEGLTLVRLDECGGVPGEQGVALVPEAGRVPASSRESFTRQLSSLLAAGVPLATALYRLAKEAHSEVAGRVWQAIHDLIADGTSLADAMNQFPRVFPRVHIAMVRAGEKGGFLALVLEQISDFQARERDLRGRIVAALVYPAVLAVLSVGAVIFLLAFFIPRFEAMFSDFGATLPLLTRLIMGTSAWIRQWGLVVALVVACALLAIREWGASERGRRHWEALLLGLPVFGVLTARLAMTRFCRMFGTLLKAGVPLVSALDVAERSLGNQVLVDAVHEGGQHVRQGSRLADSLSQCTLLFPGSVVEIISVAEQAGRLDDELIRLADTTEKEVDRRLRMAVALAEPALLFVMAGIIGTIVIGMVLPIFALQDYIR
ncbi:MAG: type II secretion system F family protein [Lentisphaerae bacterium]|jgi:type II secretory pathway component PulF|nr:type II secretion system F family protein [Lentisphaerota bacterium]MBT4821856.1 type II secretion system F family protein [Lentisphaerota bacterium]MBT5605497.1 type II secretion system F family protein [Lentisphaerota bacterium]MBT7060072.1 type II secretion system F family protein [Lentisphaerota bacterium]MBT7840868.1 type II secretion system F family protein [Lentisphaerota bacterium]